jgi:hypothetical protein
MAKKKVAKKKLKPRGKAFEKRVPDNTPQRKKAIEKFKATVEVKPHPYSAAGQPRKISTAEEMQELCDQYFEWIKGEKEIRKIKVPTFGRKGYEEVEEVVWIREPEPPTITGLALYLGFTGRQGLQSYIDAGGAFFVVVKRAKARVSGSYEKNLHGGKSIGSMFALKNIDGWKDSTEIVNEAGENAIKGWNYVTPPDPRNTKDDKEK